MRKDAAQQEVACRLLSIAAATVTEPEHTKENTICCGNFHMMRAINPEKSKAMRDSWLNEFAQDTLVTSYCEGCLGAFKD